MEGNAPRTASARARGPGGPPPAEKALPWPHDRARSGDRRPHPGAAELAGRAVGRTPTPPTRAPAPRTHRLDLPQQGPQLGHQPLVGHSLGHIAQNGRNLLLSPRACCKSLQLRQLRPRSEGSGAVSDADRTQAAPVGRRDGRSGRHGRGHQPAARRAAMRSSPASLWRCRGRRAPRRPRWRSTASFPLAQWRRRHSKCRSRGRRQRNSDFQSKFRARPPRPAFALGPKLCTALDHPSSRYAARSPGQAWSWTTNSLLTAPRCSMASHWAPAAAPVGPSYGRRAAPAGSQVRRYSAAPLLSSHRALRPLWQRLAHSFP